MIVTVTGTPGAGKTLYTCRLIAKTLIEGRFVATNIVLVEDWPERVADGLALPVRMTKRKRRLMDAWQRRLAYVESFDDLARVRLSPDGWEGRLEGRGRAIFDEAGPVLDSRDTMVGGKDARAERKRRITFLQQHRKLGWDVYLISQDLAMIDSRAQAMSEYEVRLLNLRREKMNLLGIPFVKVPIGLGATVFSATWTRPQVVRAKPADREWFRLNKRIAGLYDTHQIVHRVERDGEAAELLWLPRPDASQDPDPDGAALLGRPAGSRNNEPIAVADDEPAGSGALDLVHDVAPELAHEQEAEGRSPWPLTVVGAAGGQTADEPAGSGGSPPPLHSLNASSQVPPVGTAAGRQARPKIPIPSGPNATIASAMQGPTKTEAPRANGTLPDDLRQPGRDVCEPG